MTQDVEITFICTGRKTEEPKHSRVLYRVTLAPDEGQGSSAMENAMDRLTLEISHPLRRSRQSQGAEQRSGTGLASFSQRVWHKADPMIYRPSGELIPVVPMKCKTCGWQRDFPYVDLVEVMEKLHHIGLAEVDISMIPNAKLGSS